MYDNADDGRKKMLYIMRHGKTDWNAKKKLQGRVDIPLNEEGIEMAKKAKDEYKDVHFDVCFCSPLIRAKQTAHLVLAGRNIPIIEDERLVEMSFGICEGVENYAHNQDYPIHILFERPQDYRIPVEGGESLQEVYARTGAFLKEVVEPLLKQDKDILIVGHGAMNSSIVCQVRGLPVKKYWSAGIENCKLMRLI